MGKYEDDDIVTYYFVINDDGENRMIQGWTDNKDLAKFYMMFHKCKNFKLKALTKTFYEITKILEENNNDEIEIHNITTRDPKKKNKNGTKEISVPMTRTEVMYITEECRGLVASMVNYSFIDSAMPYLKKKYQDVLKGIMLADAIKASVHNNRSNLIENMQFDHLELLIHSFPGNFGS